MANWSCGQWHPSLLSFIYHHNLPPCLEGKLSLMTCVVLSSICPCIFLSIRSEITLASPNGQFTGSCKTFGEGAPLHEPISCSHCGGDSVALQPQISGYEMPAITTERMILYAYLFAPLHATSFFEVLSNIDQICTSMK